MNYKLGMVYSPYQNWQNLYPCDKGFTEGTIFMELNKPFEGYKNGKGGCCLL
ncbi:MAG: spore coat associated protein CotJA [Clostridia bacterium]|nr:spore coat associated protein CotJA [Clostridia bacterium]